jgi:hypothetical protein
VRGLVGGLPWSFAAPLAVHAAMRHRRAPAVALALATFAIPLLVVLASHTQRTRYLLPVYPGLALLVAWWADSAERTPTRARRVLGALAALAAAVAVAASTPELLARLRGPDRPIAVVEERAWSQLRPPAGFEVVGRRTIAGRALVPVRVVPGAAAVLRSGTAKEGPHGAALVPQPA